jgi:outer membrane protein insertion porin family
VTAGRVACLAVVVITLGLVPRSVAADAKPLLRVEVTGNQRVEADAIRINIESRPGQPIDAATVDRDVRSIYAMGFFDQVRAVVDDTPDGPVLQFVVTERPLVRKVEVKGTDAIDKDEIEGALRIRPHMILDPVRVREGVAAAKKKYADQGYLDAKIDVKQTEAPEHEVDLLYTVDEGEPVRIRKIVIEGNEAFSDRKLRGLMQTKKRWLLSRFTGAGNLNRDVLKTDMERLTAWYYEHGYVTVRIDEPQIERDKDGIVVTVKISEGEPFDVGKVEIADPAAAEPVVAAPDDLETKSGERFRTGALREDVQHLVDKLSDEGFAFAEVEPDTHVDVDRRQVDVTFRVKRGEPVVVRRIEITGNQKTRDFVLRREMRLQEQQRFSGTELRKSRNALQRLGFFRDVKVSTRKTDSPGALDVVVDVTEGQTGAFSAGAGFSSADSLLFNVQIQENNLFGRGQRLVLNADAGSIRRNIVLSFTEPYFLATPLTVGVDAFNWKLRFDGFDRSGTGAGVNVSYPVTALGWDELWGASLEDVRIGLGYRFEQADIGNVGFHSTPSIRAESGTSIVSSITPRITRNTLNHAFDPTAGSFQDLSLEVAGLGGSKFLKAELRNRYFYTFWHSKRFGDFTYSLGTTTGYGRGSSGLGGDELPLFERYFPGGIDSVRGFQARTLGPREGRRNRFGRVLFTTPVGGSVLLVANNEVIFPLVRGIGLKGVVFVDAGNAYRRVSDISYDTTRFSAGAGVRWLSPLGPLRIELGVPFNDKPGDQKSLVLFSFGGPFQF